MDWLRLYTTTLDCPKLQRLSGESFKNLINLWCLARLHDGILPPPADIAFRLRMSEVQASEMVEIFIEKGLLDRLENGVTPHDWQEFQYPSDSSTSRVREHRKRLLKQGKKQHETFPKRFRNGTEQTRTEQIREEKPSCANETSSVDGETATAPNGAVKIGRPSKDRYDENHEKWYLESYWCHKGKSASRKAYEKAVNLLHDRDGMGYGSAHLFLMAKATEDRGKFEHTEDWEWRVNLHPATWLNGQRWTDEVNTSVPSHRQNGRKSFVDDVERVIQRNLEETGKPW